MVGWWGPERKPQQDHHTVHHLRSVGFAFDLDLLENGRKSKANATEEFRSDGARYDTVTIRGHDDELIYARVLCIVSYTHVYNINSDLIVVASR